MTSIKDFRLDLSDLAFTGRDLARPECVVAEDDGTLWVSDSRGVATRIAPDGTQTLLGPEVGGEPNGLCIDADGSLLVATMGGGTVIRLHRDGRSEVVLDAVDGKPLGSVNFCFRDPRGRVYVSVLTRQVPWWGALAGGLADGYIVLIDERGARIVADGLRCCNEVRLDESGAFLYAAETMAARILRYPVRPDGSLGLPQVFGPDGYGPGGYLDGFAIDAEGNLWVVPVCRNALWIVTPAGDAHPVFEDANDGLLRALDQKIAARTAEPMDLVMCAGRTVQLPTSIAFGGPDRRTCYMGSLAMPHLVTFRSPVPGLPLAHQRA
jgi:sugar lactone lactonase YvrE